MKSHVTEEGKMAQDKFTRAMKTLFRTPKSAIQETKQKPTRKKISKSR